MTTENTLFSDLDIINTLVYEKCGLVLKNLHLNPESIEYNACSFELNEHKIEHRASKITPTKTGQFVTIWKRNNMGITTPFDFSDTTDFIVITSRRDNDLGQFIFPKSVLAEKGIISQNGKEGKRGIRVYPPWDITNNKQAEKTQTWQTKYFLTIKDDKINNLDFMKNLLAKTNKVLNKECN